jgi:hypothetical protein
MRLGLLLFSVVLTAPSALYGQELGSAFHDAYPAKIDSVPAPQGPKGLDRLPFAARSGVSTALGEDIRSYSVRTRGEALVLENTEQGFSTSFTSEGVQVHAGTGDFRMKLSGYGYGDTLKSVANTTPVARLNRMEYVYEGLKEWYVNGPIGLEQSFLIASRPGNSNGRPLTISLALSGNFQANTPSGGQDMNLSAHDGTSALRYTGLNAYDARGRKLHAWLEVQGQQLFLKIEDSGAHYPLLVDPWIQSAKIHSSDGRETDQFGWSVSSTPTTIVVGTYTCCSGSAAYVFVKPGSGWASTAKFAAKLTSSSGPAADWFGYAVSVSGNTVVVGAPLATVASNSWRGEAYVYVKPNSGWKNMSETARLTASDGLDNDMLGSSVAISGNSVIAGAPRATVGSSFYQGAAYIFVRPSGGWKSTTQAAKLTSSDAVAESFGGSVALSANTAVVGANMTFASGFNQGAAYLYTKPSTGWTDASETAKLTPSTSPEHEFMGQSVAIYGNTVAAGAPGAIIGSNGSQGAVYLFVRPKDGWATRTETAILTASDGVTNDNLGWSVSLSGSNLVAGAPGASVGGKAAQGVAYVFAKPASGWKSTSSFSAKLKAKDGAATDRLGNSVSISGTTASGYKIVLGSPQSTIGSNYAQGAIYLF